MATWIRRLVSKNKRRFQDGPHGFDLDLAYIAPRIIAMGLPAEGKDVLYRNPLPEIARFLATYHQGRAKVYNLCSEHRYSADKLPGVLLQQFPFDDHQTPALRVVQQFCTDAAAWLAAHPHNVVAVHCKAGKGRTGIMICCLMLYLHINAPALANLPDRNSADAGNSAAAAAAAGGAAVTGVGGAAAVTALDGADSKAEDTVGFVVPPPQGTSRTLPVGSSSSGDSSSGSHLKAAGPSDGWHPWQSVEPLLLQQLPEPAQTCWTCTLCGARMT
ncbi:protein-tyrosine phosphatase-like protein [Scenedesmus sp. NREL 46B-D3]|nr:protein-tyrosine phosphatase-like protein [Scenedesmus sp. NREL 46B-D3]